MSETNKSQMLSEAEIIEAINQDSLISVSLGAGQPQKNVKMSTLASVAAGLITYPFGRRSSIGSYAKTNFNDITEPGMYDIVIEGEGSINAPSDIAYGLLLVFRRDNMVVQMAISVNNNAQLLRGRIGGNWQNWRAI